MAFQKEHTEKVQSVMLEEKVIPEPYIRKMHQTQLSQGWIRIRRQLNSSWNSVQNSDPPGYEPS
jgi:hypothetical protein